MPLIEVTTNRRVCASVRLFEATASQVDQYAAFIKATPDDVIDRALEYVFSKDRGFQDFLKTDSALKVPPLLRTRRSAVGDGNSSRERVARGLSSAKPAARSTT
jgi:hypothetical protein